jgi:hypothetical protein
LEDKIVGPLTLVQFIYILASGLIDYIMYQAIGQSHLGIFLLLGIPIALLGVALAFLKIQDQPLSHFIQAGIMYLQQPKIRFWKRGGYVAPAIFVPGKAQASIQPTVVHKSIEKTNLERLAYILDTRPQSAASEENFGKVTKSFETLFKSGYLKVEPPKQGGNVGVGQTQTTNNSQHPRGA